MKKIFVIIFGLIFLGVGIFLLVSGNDKAKRCTTEAVGTVAEIIEEREENYNDTDAIVYDAYTYTYYPVIEYKVGERTISQKYSVGSGNKDKYKVGENLEILYDANKPEDFIIKGDKTTNFIGIVFIAVGAITAIVGVVKKDFV